MKDYFLVDEIRDAMDWMDLNFTLGVVEGCVRSICSDYSRGLFFIYN